MSVHELYPAYLISDLADSGLEPVDVQARVAGPNEKQATNTPAGLDAYVLPYFDMAGKSVPFYRVKLIDNPDPSVKYKQIATSSNHVYFPPGLQQLLRSARYILVTEGEKKAAAAVKAGFPCVAFGGVDSWRNRTITLHKDAQIGQSKSGQVVAKLPAGAELSEAADTLATGMQELINWVIRKQVPMIICYDSDLSVTDYVRFEVQRAAATLGYEMRFRGIPFAQIKQMVLSPESASISGDKLGLDDFLVHEELGPDTLDEQIQACLALRTAFPRHPNPKDFVNKRMAKPKKNRNDFFAISTSLIAELDARGIRLHCEDNGSAYYFDEKTFKLMKVMITDDMSFAQTPFGIKLYNEYGLTTGDRNLLEVLHTQFWGEQPIQKVKPEKILTIRGDTLYYQISDGQMIRINAQGITLLTNGADNVLFEGDLVKPVPHTQLIDAVRKYKAQEVLDSLWYPVLKDARIRESSNDYARKILALLYSISPWFYRWRGAQLPLEQMLGEAGSGKSTLYALRQQILAGESKLRNAPRDIRDWTASIASTGGLHVTDNVHMSNKGLKQQLSDEMCRVITESDPHIEARKLYTDNELIRVPVQTVFAVTAIKQPFTNTDIIQRSIITELDKGSGVIEYDADWEQTQLRRFGGRVHWIAHQIVFTHRLFQLIEKKWKTSYRAKFRLINVEQLLMLAAEVYGWDGDWIPDYLESTRDERTAKSDAALEGLIMWSEDVRARVHPRQLAGTVFTAQDMVHYFEAEEEWDKHIILTNARSLGHYLEAQKNVVANIAGIIATGHKRNNRNTFQVVPMTDNGDAG